MALRLFFTALWLLGGWSLAQACEDVVDAGTELLIPDFGTAYFTSLGASLQAGEVTLSDGVCIVGLEGWELRSETLSVMGLDGVVRLEASDVSLVYFGWQVNATSLIATEGSIAISRVDFANESVAGTSEEAVFNLEDNILTLNNAAAEGSGFRIRGEIARLSGNVLFFEDALATTCVCEGGALYVIRSPSASYDLTQQAVVINEGQLVVGGITISLPDLELTQEKLANIAFPIVIEYVTDDEAKNVEGTGLGIRVPNLRVTDELRLELGLAGLDNDYPLVGVAMLHYKDKDDKVSFDVGRSPRGVQADFSVREPLLPWLDINFSVRNRNWSAANFLHEGSLGLVAQQTYAVAGHRFDFAETVFAAASSQTISSTVIATPRLGAYAVSSYRSPDSAWGQFSFRAKAEVTDYPLLDKTQFGLRLQPSWTKSFDPWQFGLSWDRIFTNAASPFAESLDRLEAKNELRLSLKAEDDLNPNLSASFDLGLRYDFLNPEESLGEKLEAFTFLGALGWQRDELTLSPFLNTELAPLFNSTLEDIDSYIEGGLNLERGRVQAGFSLKFDPELDEPLEKVKLSTSFPLDFETFTLEPFLAVDLLPTLRNRELPRVTGQGLKVTWRSCCGTVIASFKQVENTFSTSFAFQLSEP